MRGAPLSLALLALISPARAASGLVQLGRSGAAPALYAAPAEAWAPVLDGGRLFPLPLGDAPASALGPAIKVLEARGWDAARFLGEPPERQAELVRDAGLQAHRELAEDAEALARQARELSPDRPEFPLVVARLHMLGTHLVPYLEAPELALVTGAYRAARERLSAEQSRLLEASLRRSADSLAGEARDRLTAVEALAAALPTTPARYMSPRVAALRREAQRPQEAALPPPTPGFKARLAAVAAGNALKRFAARRLYRPFIDAFHRGYLWAGELLRKVLGITMDRHNWRWHVLEVARKERDFRGAFGHPVHEGTAEVESDLIFPAELMAGIRSQTRRVGQAELGPMISISGMSFPQLSAPSVLTLLHNHIALAKEVGARTTFNTGEGGPHLHLGLLEGDRKKVEEYVIDWGLAHDRFSPGGWTHAKVLRFIEDLFDAREEVFKGFSPEDIARAQIVAQFGSGLNGIRGPGSEVDFDKLGRIAASPFVKMTQFKLKQAAKRGAKVNLSKINAVVAAFRDIDARKNDKAPEIIPDFDSYESIAILIKAARIVTGKPVSLKFGIGRPKDILDFLEALRDADALPDHIQLDGRGADFSPGTGNAPPGANTSLPSNEAVIVLDAVLKKLGIRDKIVVEATGDILLPIDAVEKLALGADCVAAARGWMGIGLGCAMVMDCAKGKCPYGITASPETFLEMSLDPAKEAPIGLETAANWFRAYTQTLAETKVSDWRELRKRHGLASRSDAIRVQKGGKVWTLDEYYDEKYVANLLRNALTRAEVRRYVYGRRF